jgi:predicted phosphoribosyltransferase
MNEQMPSNVFDRPDLRGRVRVFCDRNHAGQILAGMLPGDAVPDALVLGIPAGGVPVAAAIAGARGVALDVAVVSKITLPWDTEAGYGAVAFDGTVNLNEAMLIRTGLTRTEIDAGIAATRAKVTRRTRDLRKGRGPLDISGRRVVLVDDGLASGITMRVAVAAVTRLAVSEIIVCVPTGHADAVRALAAEVGTLYCANIRSGFRFAVASAYRHWTDVDEKEVLSHLKSGSSR